MSIGSVLQSACPSRLLRVWILDCTVLFNENIMDVTFFFKVATWIYRWSIQRPHSISRIPTVPSLESTFISRWQCSKEERKTRCFGQRLCKYFHIIFILLCILCVKFNSSTIGYSHDGIIWLQLPESFAFTLCYYNVN